PPLVLDRKQEECAAARWNEGGRAWQRSVELRRVVDDLLVARAADASVQAEPFEDSERLVWTESGVEEGSLRLRLVDHVMELLRAVPDVLWVAVLDGFPVVVEQAGHPIQPAMLARKAEFAVPVGHRVFVVDDGIRQRRAVPAGAEAR